jgi:cyclophilin family peptidyl-prolyl cis-trans isomerase
VGTEKRERQKANRALGKQQQAKAESKRRTFRLAAIVIGGLVAIFGLVWIATVVTGDDETDVAVSDSLPLDSLPGESLPGESLPLESLPTGSLPVDTLPGETLPGEPVPSTPAGTEPVTSDVATVPCPPVDGVTEPVRGFDAPPPMCLEEGATYQAVVTTNSGEFTVDLDADAAPVTVNNFVFLARNGYFDETPCHRIITDFVVQCGDPTGTGTGGPGYEFDDELPAEGEYQLGSVVMANSGPNTNGSQFFIVTGEQGVALPPLYALFGQVSEGFDTAVADMAAAGSESGTPTAPVDIVSVRIVQS